MSGAEFEEAAAAAERLAASVKQRGTLDPIYESLDTAIVDLTAKGYKPSDLLPADAEPGIGFSLNEKRDGKTLWQAIAVAGRESICDPAGDVRKRLSGAGNANVGALLGAVMVALGLPFTAIPVAVSIVAFLLSFGIKGFCNWASAEPSEPATP